MMISIAFLRRLLAITVGAGLLLSDASSAAADLVSSIDSALVVDQQGAIGLVAVDGSGLVQLVQGGDFRTAEVDPRSLRAVTEQCLGKGMQRCTLQLVDLPTGTHRELGNFTRPEGCYMSAGFTSDGAVAWARVGTGTCATSEISLFPLTPDDSPTAHPILQVDNTVWVAGRPLNIGNNAQVMIAPDGNHLFASQFEKETWMYDARGTPLHAIPEVQGLPEAFGNGLAWTSADKVLLTDADGANAREVLTGASYQISAASNGAGIFAVAKGDFRHDGFVPYALDWISADGSVRHLGDGASSNGDSGDVFAFLSASGDRAAIRINDPTRETPVWQIVDLASGATSDLPDRWAVVALSPQGHYALLGRYNALSSAPEAAMLDVESVGILPLPEASAGWSAAFSADERFVVDQDSHVIATTDGTMLLRGLATNGSRLAWAHRVRGRAFFTGGDGK